jgi:hypothetical protein
MQNLKKKFKNTTQKVNRQSFNSIGWHRVRLLLLSLLLLLLYYKTACCIHHLSSNLLTQ